MRAFSSFLVWAALPWAFGSHLSSDAPTWDQRNQTFDRAEAHLAAVFAHEAYCPDTEYCPHGGREPRMPQGWTLVGTYPDEGFRNGFDYGFLARSSAACVASFRGSVDLADWISNVNIVWTDFKMGFSYIGETMTWTHTGFRRGYNDVCDPSRHSSFMRDLEACLGQNRKLIITGHSRGGALASHLGMQVANSNSHAIHSSLCS